MKRWDEILRRLPEGRPTIVAEVGVWKGQLSARLLAARSLLTLFMVDLWLPGASNPSWLASGSKMAAQPADVVEAAMRGCESIAARFRPRVRIVREASAPAALQFADGTFDMVFVDADHSQLAVLADIQSWRGKVKMGGWLGGHDYGKARFSGVKDAVLQVFRPTQIETGDDSTWWVKL